MAVRPLFGTLRSAIQGGAPWCPIVDRPAQVFASLQQMFTGAREIQNWLTNTAKEIARSKPLAVVEALEEELTSARDRNHAANAGADTPKRSKTILRRLNKRIRQGETLVVWVTPLGLPIVQPYRRRNVRQVRHGPAATFLSARVLGGFGPGRSHGCRRRTAATARRARSARPCK